MSIENNGKVLQARGVSFFYQEGTKALDAVDFYVRKEEFTAMLASNGSGKTTLLKLLVKLLTPQQGEVFLNGRRIHDMPAKNVYQQVGLVLQNPNDQLFAATVAEDVAFGPRNLGLTEREISERTREALEYVGAGDLAHRAIHHLSFGEQKRVSLAGVLAMHPSVLVLDEPTAALDPAGETNMLYLLNRLNKEYGITIVMATHSVDMLPLFVDRIYVLNNGRVLREGTAESIFNDHDLVNAAGLRLPHISRLIHELRSLDGMPVNGLPLTIREARLKLVEMISSEELLERLKK